MIILVHDIQLKSTIEEHVQQNWQEMSPAIILSFKALS